MNTCSKRASWILILLSIWNCITCTRAQTPADLCANGLELLHQLPDHPYLIQPRENTKSEQWGLLQICERVTDLMFQSSNVTVQLSGKALQNAEQIRVAGTELLESSSELGNTTATRVLAEMNMYGNFTTSRNFTKALELYEELAEQGDASAQFMCGVFYSTGMFGTVEPDQAKASMYYTFSAFAGNIKAQMAMAFRHYLGIAGTMNSEQALPFYKSAASAAYSWYMPDPTSPLLERSLRRNTQLIPRKQTGGIYGQGVGWTGAERRDSGTLDEALEFYQYAADSHTPISHMVAAYDLARIYYEGDEFSEPDYEKAYDYALECASVIWSSHGKVRNSVDSQNRFVVESGGLCAVYLGRFYYRGDGVEKNLESAVNWFKRGAALGNPTALSTMALLHLNGIGVKQNELYALSLLDRAAKKGLKSAELTKAKILLSNGEDDLGYKMIQDLASRGILEATYIHGIRQASLAARPDGGIEGDHAEEACRFLKHFVEKVEDMNSPLGWAQKAHREGDYESAILGFLIAAEQGYQSAQINVAYLLDDQGGFIDLRRNESKNIHKFSNALKTALVYWGRSATQSVGDSLLKMGDYYLEGKGTEADSAKAFTCYTYASNKMSGMANWNLGWMHENGIGVEKDYHLAKRHYDLALESEPSAFLPVQSSLIKLYVKSFWNDMTGGKIKSIVNESLNGPRITLVEGIRKVWTAWKEMDFKSMEDTEENEQSSSETRQEENTDDYGIETDDIRDLVLIVAFLSLLIFAWARQRRQQRNNAQNNNNNNENNNNLANNNAQFRVHIGFGGMGFQFGGNI